jgi:hypothetical protein
MDFHTENKGRINMKWKKQNEPKMDNFPCGYVCWRFTLDYLAVRLWRMPGGTPNFTTEIVAIFFLLASVGVFQYNRRTAKKVPDSAFLMPRGGQSLTLLLCERVYFGSHLPHGSN